MSDEPRRGLPSSDRLNAIGRLAMRGVIWQHRAVGTPVVSADADGNVFHRDPWDMLLSAVPQLSETVGPLPAEDAAARDQAREALGRLITEAERIVRESGDPSTFDAARWAGEFLVMPHPALGGRRPADLFHTPEGQEQVLNLVAQMQSGGYA